MEKAITYVEFGSTGHRPVWIRSIIKAFINLGSDWHLNIWVPHEFIKYHEDWCSPYVEGKTTGRNVIFKTPFFHESYFKKIKLSKEINGASALNRFNIAEICARADRSKVCFVANNLAHCSREIAFQYRKTNGARIVGILDPPALHYKTFSSKRTRDWLTKRRYLREFLRTFFMCHRKDMGKILMLDPLAPAYYNNRLRSSKFHFLPEYIIPTEPDLSLKEKFALPHNRKLILFPGNIDARKGILEFLEGLHLALNKSAVLRNQITAVIAGPVDTEIYQRFYEKIALLQSCYPDVPIMVFDRFLGDDEFVSLFALADIIAIPYRNFVGTSNILVHAAAFRRPVVASDFGLVGELVNRYHLGITCDESNAASLSEAIFRSVTESGEPSSHKTSGMERFANHYAVLLPQFAEKVVEELLKVGQQK